jgi:hypothetical protein
MTFEPDWNLSGLLGIIMTNTLIPVYGKEIIESERLFKRHAGELLARRQRVYLFTVDTPSTSSTLEARRPTKS